MLRPITAFFAPRLPRLDDLVMRWTNGRRTVSELMGWTIVQLHTVGAKTGRPHHTPLIGILDGETIGLIASNFGRAGNPGWYYNLKKNPRCSVLLNGSSGNYLAREAEGEEREKYWRMALSCYEGYETYEQRAAPRRIPVLVLTPVK